MNKTTRYITPGGSPAMLENPPFSEVGSTDSGKSRLLQSNDPFSKSSRVSRSPPPRSNNSGKRSPPGAPTRQIQDSAKYKSLEEENKTLRIKLNEMDLLYQDLKKEIDLLKEENKVLKNTDVQKEHECTPARVASREYHTDEEELERETNRVPKKRPSKKRRAGSSPEVELPKKEKLKEPQKNQLRAQFRPPPPINVVGIMQYNKLHSLLKETLTAKYKVTSLRDNAWKINVDNIEDYRAVSQKLNSEKIQWYTFVAMHGLYSNQTNFLRATSFIKFIKRGSALKTICSFPCL